MFSSQAFPLPGAACAVHIHPGTWRAPLVLLLQHQLASSPPGLLGLSWSPVPAQVLVLSTDCKVQETFRGEVHLTNHHVRKVH